MIKIKNRLFLFLLVLFFLSSSCLFSCRKEKVIVDGGFNDIREEIVLFVIESNNSLKYESFQTVNRLEKSVVVGQNILVYINSANDRSFLLKVKKDNNDYIINSDTIAMFYKSNDNIGTISECLKWIKDKDKWDISGLILWSHGTSWYPDTTSNQSLYGKKFFSDHGEIKLKSFGDDRGEKIDVKRLASIIPKVNFLIFDACSMGTMEVLYEFRDKAKYIVASPTETLAESIPYQKVTPLLNNSSEDLENICKIYMDYYKSFSDLRKSASISLFDMSKFDLLANKLKGFRTLRLTQDFEEEKIMRIDFSDNFPGPIYDFSSFVNRNFDTNEAEILNGLAQECILYSDHTEQFLGNKIENLSGVGISVVNQNNKYFDYYNNLKWGIDTKVEPTREK